MYVPILAYDHIGIRVSNAERSIAFYQSLGFEIDPDFSNANVAELVTSAGVRINLIFNGVPRDTNILMDEPVKWPGYTHPAFIVGSMDAFTKWATSTSVKITEGPVNWERRLTCFIRDPDGNVLEFNELI